MSVKNTHPQYNRFTKIWKRCRDIVCGEDAVKNAGAIYLSRLKDQTDESYKGYVERASFYNASSRTIEGLGGMLFRKTPKVDVPDAIKVMLADVDMSGTPLTIFAQEVAQEVLEVGRVGLLVDHPPIVDLGDTPVTKAVVEQLGIRPQIKIYKTETILNWKSRRVNNATVICMVVLEEEEEIEGKDEFTSSCEARYRVLDLTPEGLYRQRLFKIGVDLKDVQIGGDVFPIMNGKPMTFIPFVFITPDSVRNEVDEPPLLDLINVNLSHWRVSADYEHACHFVGLPTPWITGYQVTAPEDGKPPDKFYIGSETAWVFPDANAKVGFLEFAGQGLTALTANLDRKEQQMAILGARMIAAEKKQAETATTSAIHRTGENSILAKIAISVSLAIKSALQIFSDWSGNDGTVDFEINRNFLPVAIDAATFVGLLKAVQSGRLSFESFFDLLQRADMVESEKTALDEIAEIIKDVTTFAPTVPPPAPGANGPPADKTQTAA